MCSLWCFGSALAPSGSALLLGLYFEGGPEDFLMGLLLCVQAAHRRMQERISGSLGLIHLGLLRVSKVGGSKCCDVCVVRAG